MFISDKLIITQYEHSKLAGLIASNLKEDLFENQEVSESFIKAVYFHDRGFGTFDNLPVGQMSQKDHYEVLKRSFYEDCDDIRANLSIKYHVLRLISYSNTKEAQNLLEKFKKEIRIYEKSHNLNTAEFKDLDLIMDLCDSISFDFCFQKESNQTYNMPSTFKALGFESIFYKIKPENHIELHPWPFKAPSIKGELISYKKESFPEKRNPVILKFNIDS
jgi:hypothetical protein